MTQPNFQAGRQMLLLAFLLLTGNLHAEESLATAWQSTTLSGYAKAMYIADDKKGGRLNQSTPGFGGRLGAASGEHQGWSLQGAYYVTSDLGLRRSNVKETDGYMFDLDKKPYALLGEAQINYRFGKTRLSIGRQEIDTPLITSYEYRIIPNLFEASTLTNQDLANTTLTLAYVSKMSGLDGLATYSEFHSMSQQAYTSLLVNGKGAVDARNGDTFDLSRAVGQHGVWVAGAAYAKEHQLQAWNYLGVDTLNTFYVDGRLKQKLGDGLTAFLDGQTYRVNGVGRFKEYLHQRGLNADYQLYGAKGTLAHQPSGLSLSLAFTHFSGDEHTVTAHGNWGGYPEFVNMPYLYAEKDGVSAIARSHMSKASALIDLGAYGLSKHSLLLGHARINLDQNILADSNIRVNTLIYRAKLSNKLSTRVHFEARNSGNARYDNQFLAMALRYDF